MATPTNSQYQNYLSKGGGKGLYFVTPNRNTVLAKDSTSQESQSKTLVKVVLISIIHKGNSLLE